MKLVKESILENKKLEISSGFVIIQNNKILLAHPTGSGNNRFSFPKGHIESKESLLDTAKRETKEEVGLKFNNEDIIEGPYCIDYIYKNNEIYKKVYYYIVKPSKIIEKDGFKIQKSEMDWVGFMSKSEAENKIFWRLKEVLKHLKDD